MNEGCIAREEKVHALFFIILKTLSLDVQMFYDTIKKKSRAALHANCVRFAESEVV